MENKSSTPLESARDRGYRDSYYRAGFNPHYLNDNTRVDITDIGSDLWEAYRRAYTENQENFNFKEW